jgi:UDP-glucose 4-epimerase
VVNALVNLIDHPAAVGQVFNIGSTEEVSIGELAELVKVLTCSRSEIVLVPYDQAYEAGFEDMPRRIPDTSKIHALVGFRHTKTLEQIVQSVIAYYRGQAPWCGEPMTAPAQPPATLAEV